MEQTFVVDQQAELVKLVQSLIEKNQQEQLKRIEEHIIEVTDSRLAELRSKVNGLQNNKKLIDSKVNSFDNSYYSTLQQHNQLKHEYIPKCLKMFSESIIEECKKYILEPVHASNKQIKDQLKQEVAKIKEFDKTHKTFQTKQDLINKKNQDRVAKNINAISKLERKVTHSLTVIRDLDLQEKFDDFLTDRVTKFNKLTVGKHDSNLVFKNEFLKLQSDNKVVNSRIKRLEEMQILEINDKLKQIENSIDSDRTRNENDLEKVSSNLDKCLEEHICEMKRDFEASWQQVMNEALFEGNIRKLKELDTNLVTNEQLDEIRKQIAGITCKERLREGGQNEIESIASSLDNLRQEFLNFKNFGLLDTIKEQFELIGKENELKLVSDEIADKNVLDNKIEAQLIEIRTDFEQFRKDHEANDNGMQLADNKVFENNIQEQFDKIREEFEQFKIDNKMIETRMNEAENENVVIDSDSALTEMRLNSLLSRVESLTSRDSTVESRLVSLQQGANLIERQITKLKDENAEIKGDLLNFKTIEESNRINDFVREKLDSFNSRLDRIENDNCTMHDNLVGLKNTRSEINNAISVLDLKINNLLLKVEHFRSENTGTVTKLDMLQNSISKINSELDNMPLNKIRSSYIELTNCLNECKKEVEQINSFCCTELNKIKKQNTEISSEIKQNAERESDIKKICFALQGVQFLTKPRLDNIEKKIEDIIGEIKSCSEFRDTMCVNLKSIEIGNKTAIDAINSLLDTINMKFNVLENSYSVISKSAEKAEYRMKSQLNSNKAENTKIIQDINTSLDTLMEEKKEIMRQLEIFETHKADTIAKVDSLRTILDINVTKLELMLTELGATNFRLNEVEIMTKKMVENADLPGQCLRDIYNDGAGSSGSCSDEGATSVQTEPPLPPPSVPGTTMEEKISHMTVVALRSFFIEHSINFKGCYEKSDLMAKLVQLWKDLSKHASGQAEETATTATSMKAAVRRIATPTEMVLGIANADEIDTKSVRELKQILAANSVDTRGWKEKSRFVERLTQLWKELRQPEAGEEDSRAVCLDTDKDLCWVCMDALIDCVLLECGHQVTCNQCGHKCKACPVCRANIARVVRTYRP